MPSAVTENIDYDAASQSLYIRYILGQCYIYQEVPKKVYQELKASRSKGRYLRYFTKGKYPFEKTNDGASGLFV